MLLRENEKSETELGKEKKFGGERERDFFQEKLPLFFWDKSLFRSPSLSLFASKALKKEKMSVNFLLCVVRERERERKGKSRSVMMKKTREEVDLF